MKSTFLFAVTAALFLAGCGSFTERPADRSDSSENVKYSGITEESKAEESSEVTEESSAAEQAESSSADESSEVTESRADTPEDSKADAKDGQFPGGIDDDGRGPDEEHFGVETGFAPGIWWSFCEIGDRYYEFSTDGTGMRAYQTDGFKEGFTYEMDEGSAVFSFAGIAAGAPEYTRAKAEERGDGAILAFDDGHTEELVYMGNISFDDFKFYSDRELEEMAREYYRQHNDTGYVPEYCDTLKSEADNDIVLHLYDIVGNNTATADWYYIDRFTGKGKDMMDNDIDLTTAGKG